MQTDTENDFYAQDIDSDDCGALVSVDDRRISISVAEGNDSASVELASGDALELAEFIFAKLGAKKPTDIEQLSRPKCERCGRESFETHPWN